VEGEATASSLKQALGDSIKPVPNRTKSDHLSQQPVPPRFSHSVGGKPLCSCHFSLVCDLDFLHYVSELRVARMLFAVLNDPSYGTPHSGVLLWSIRSSTELKRKKAGTLFDSRTTRPSEDEGAKDRSHKTNQPLQSNLTL
jgi:hypothetical protein